MSNQDTGATRLRCRKCRGTGIVSIISIDPRIDSRVFCDDCDIGRQRWKAVSKLIDQIETGRLTTVFVNRRSPDPTPRASS